MSQPPPELIDAQVGEAVGTEVIRALLDYYMEIAERSEDADLAFAVMEMRQAVGLPIT